MRKLTYLILLSIPMNLSAATPPTPAMIVNNPEGRLQYFPKLSSTSVGRLLDIATSPANNGDVLTFNGTKFAPAAPTSGGGGISGGVGIFDGNQTVSISSFTIQGFPVSFNSGFATITVLSATSTWTGSQTMYKSSFTIDAIRDLANGNLVLRASSNTSLSANSPALRFQGTYDANGISNGVVLSTTAMSISLIADGTSSPDQSTFRLGIQDYRGSANEIVTIGQNGGLGIRSTGINQTSNLFMIGTATLVVTREGYVTVGTMTATSSFTANTLTASSFTLVTGTLCIAGNCFLFQSSVPAPGDNVFHLASDGKSVYFGGDAVGTSGNSGGSGIFFTKDSAGGVSISSLDVVGAHFNTSIVGSSASLSLNPSTTLFIQNTGSNLLQGATFYVSSGTAVSFFASSITVNNHSAFGVAGTLSPAKVIDVEETFNNTSGDRTGVYSAITSGKANNGAITGIWGETFLTAVTGVYGNAVAGVYGESKFTSDGSTASFLIGMLTLANQTGNNVVTDAYGVFSQVWKGVGIIKTAHGLYYDGVPNANPDTGSSVGRVERQYGLHLPKLNRGTINNIHILLDASPLATGTNFVGDWGIVQEDVSSNSIKGWLGLNIGTPTSQLDVVNGSITVRGTNSDIGLGGVSFAGYMSTASAALAAKLDATVFYMHTSSGDAVLASLSAATTTLALSTTLIVNQESSDISNRTYYVRNETTGTSSAFQLLGSSPSAGAEISKTQQALLSGNLVKISSHVTTTNDPNVRKIAAGIWSFTSWAQAASITNTANLVITVSTIGIDGSNQREIVSSTSTNFVDTNVDRFDMVGVQTADVAMSTSDRILVQYFGKSTSVIGINITLFYAGTARFTHLSSPLGNTNTFVQLTDTPQSLTGSKKKYLSVSDDETTTVFVTSITDIFNAWANTKSTTDASLAGKLDAGQNNAGTIFSSMTVGLGGGSGGDSFGSHISTRDAYFTYGIRASSVVITSSLSVGDVITSSTGFIAPSSTIAWLNVSGGSVCFNGNCYVFSSSGMTAGQHLVVNAVANGHIYIVGGGDATGSASSAGGGGGAATFDGNVTTSFSTISFQTPFGLATIASGASASTATVLGSTGVWRSISIPAGSWVGMGPSSAAASWANGGFAISSTTVNNFYTRVRKSYLEMRPSTDSFAFTELQMPYEWDTSTGVKVQFWWWGSSGTASTFSKLQFGAVAIASGSASYPNFTSSMTITTAYIAPEQMIYSNPGLDTMFMPEGNPRPGNVVDFWINRSGADGGDTWEGISRIGGVTIFYRQNAWDGSPR